MSNRFDAFLMAAASKYGVDPEQLRRIIAAESNFNPDAVSPKGAQGLFQLMPNTAKELGVNNPFDPQENIMGGAKYISSLFKKYPGDPRKARAAFNFGPGNVDKGLPWPLETRNYVDKTSPPDEVAPVEDDPYGFKTAETPLGRPAHPPPEQEHGFWRRFVGGMADTPGGKMVQALGGVGKRALESETGRQLAAGIPGGPTYSPPPPTPTPAPPIAPRPTAPGVSTLPPGPNVNPRLLEGPNAGTPTVNPNAMASVPQAPQPGPTTGGPDEANPDVLRMLVQHLRDAPKAEDYKPRGWRNVAGLIGAGLTGAVEGPSAGIREGQRYQTAGYERALREYGAKGESLGTMGKLEELMMDRKDREAQRALQAKNVDSEIKTREGNLKENQRRTDYAIGKGPKTGPEKPVPVGQQHQAWQESAAELYATDRLARKYLTKYTEGGKTVYEITPIASPSNHWWTSDTEFTPAEEKEKLVVMDKINKRASERINTMVDPYRSRRPPVEGFGMEDQP